MDNRELKVVILGNSNTTMEFRDGLFKEGDLATIERYNLPFSEKNIEDSVTHGHLPILIYAKSKGYRLNKRTYAYSAEGGHLEVVKWLRENGRSWDKETCIYTAEDRPEIILWIKEN